MRYLECKDAEERERFWNALRLVYRIGNGYRLCVLGDLSGKVGNRASGYNWRFWSSMKK